MDLLESCEKAIHQRIGEINKENKGNNEFNPEQNNGQTQVMAEALFSDKDKDLDKILGQQTFLKRIIDEDNNIQSLKAHIANTMIEIEELRKACSRINDDAMKARRELKATHSKDLEKYQMAQLRSIAEDYRRHQDILESRKTEVRNLKKEIEKERNGREAYLADVEKKLDQQIQERQRTISAGGLPFTAGIGIFDQDDGGRASPDNIQLTSVDEYAPYGTTTQARGPGARRGGRGGRGRGVGRGRGRRSKE